MKTSQVLTASVATLLTLSLAYVFYFDYKRRHDPDFRRALEREKRRHKKEQMAAEEAESENLKTQIKEEVRRAQEEGFPTDVEERESYFMSEVARGEGLLTQGNEKALEAAICFYKALKVYPTPKDLINIYEKTVPKNILDILAVAIAFDDSTLMAEAVE